MDVKQYYRKIREIESGLNAPYLLVVSLETPDGGKAGLVSEVSRSVAAKMIVEARAVPANDQERAAYIEQQAARKEAAKRAELARRVQVAIITDSDLETAAARKNSKDQSGGK
jgi:hypothetical protein